MHISESKRAEAEAFAEKFLKQMTITEKIGQLSQFGTSIYNDEVSYLEDHYPDGRIGAFLTIKGAGLTNRIQKNVIEKSRLHIPVLFADDVIHGFRTTFPTPIAQSCSWNPELSRDCAKIAAKEAYRAGIKWVFSPMVDIARDPRWGRIVEGYGEDTYLCSCFASATVEGYEGDEPGKPDHVLSCLKHFAAYGACIGGRDYNAADVSVQTLYDVYLPPFRSGVQSGSSTVMTGFHSLNGVPCTANEFLLKKILREEFDFSGIVVSDSSSVSDLVAHGAAEDWCDAAKKAFNAGVDMNMGGETYNENLPALIAEKKVSADEIDVSVKRILVFKYLLGLFDNPYVNEEDEKCFFCEEHLETAERAAREGIVLLKNENNTLPLQSSQKRIAVIGPFADEKTSVLGSWACKPDANRTITVLEGIRDFAPENCEITYAPGCTLEDVNSDVMLNEAFDTAKNSDAVILVLGEIAKESGEAKSKTMLRLTEAQEQLWKRCAMAGRPLIVLISAGRPLIFGELADSAAAIMYIWQLGTCTGKAVAEALFGLYNPSGHLTVSFPCTEGQIPVYYNHTSTGHPALGRVWYESKYLDAPIRPAYCFGYGLSYTKFLLSDLRLSAKEMPVEGEIKIACEVRNDGQYDGEAVVQLYIRDITGSCVRPVKELKGFKKIFLGSGDSQSVEFVLKAEDTAFCNPNGQMIVEPGKFMLWLGQSCEDEALFSEFTITDK